MASVPPDFLPPDVVAGLKAKFPNGKLIPIQTEAGPVVIRPPTKQEALERFPAPVRATDALGMFDLNDGDIDKDIDFARACIVYPDEATQREYSKKLPGLVLRLAAHVKKAGTGVRGEFKGAPSDMPTMAFQLLESTGSACYQIVTDLDPDRIVLRVPGLDARRKYEAARATQSPITAAEILVLSCLVHPMAQIVQTQLSARPLLAAYCAQRLLAWSRGEVEEFSEGL